MNELGETGTLLFDANAMQLSSENGVIWLSQEDIAQLFGVEKRAVRAEISVLFQDLALDKKTAVRKAHVIVGEKEAAQAKIMTQYSLEVIIGIGLRLKSEKARQFQHATSQILISYLKRGYAVNKGYVKRRTSWLSRLEALVRKLRED